MIVRMTISEWQGIPCWKHYDLSSGDLGDRPIGKLRLRNGQMPGEDVFSAECLLIDIEEQLRSVGKVLKIQETMDAEVVQ